MLPVVKYSVYPSRFISYCVQQVDKEDARSLVARSPAECPRSSVETGDWQRPECHVW